MKNKLRYYSSCRVKKNNGLLPVFMQAPIAILGKNRDNDNKIVIFELAGRVDLENFMESIQLTPFLNARFGLMERLLRLINEQEKISKRQSGVIYVVDLEGLEMSSSLISFLTGQFCEFEFLNQILHKCVIFAGPFRIIWGTLLEQYPSIFTRIIVVKTPNYINVLWTACMPFITSSYREKISITKSANWRNELLQYIDAQRLPVHYGGTMLDEMNDERCRLLIPFPEKSTPLTEPVLPFLPDSFRLAPGNEKCFLRSICSSY
ncbi:unnamed protein product [Gongylonema pulchrum]|uniref:CRAL-TRIO domain-containing protein n=1 Tax=Gongylonema pulchrum TaxID=637853 RepID=A0A183CZU3_9BILA|nr:unnamed protein product [Gongylonema pulchrum]